MKKYPMKRTIAHKQAIQGATLIEVLVSVFLLTFGILGLMAAQLNSVAAVSESENHAIAAQAAENLAEAMQANPDLTATGKREYTKYLKTAWVDVGNIESCAKEASAAVAADSKAACALGKAISKADLAKAQLEEFQYILKQMPNAVDLKYTVCLDSVAGLPDEAKKPSLTDIQCSGSSGTGVKPVIKVVWTSMGSTTPPSSDKPDKGIPEKSAQLYYLVLPN